MVLVILTVGAWFVVGGSGTPTAGEDEAPRTGAAAGSAPSPDQMLAGVSFAPQPQPQPQPQLLPGGRRAVFEGDPLLVAYYGTDGTGSLGVLGERGPDASNARLHRQAAKFRVLGRPIQPVYELIVTIADGHPGKDGDFSHDLSRPQVQRWIDAAHRHDALVVLDLQTGSRDFLTVAKRWSWALADPWVGLALDPEWRMHRGSVPGRVIGHVDAAEINRVSAWLSAFTAQRALPQKLFVLHQFRRQMVRRPQLIRSRPHLASVQHVDGYGTPREKLATYHYVARPRQFTMGFKLFYDEDIHRMGPRAIARIRPKVRFVSFQ